MTRNIQYTIQLGSAFDQGQELIWSLIKEPWLTQEKFIVPRPRSYRGHFLKFADEPNVAPASPTELKKMFQLKKNQADQDLHLVLKMTDLMQPEDFFYADNKWFDGIGERARQLRKVLEPAPLRLFICLRNPALFLSDALQSGEYPAFKKEPPNPFTLRWASILRDLRTSLPEVTITAWCAEEGPQIWGEVLCAVGAPEDKLTLDASLRLANRLMNREGRERLTAYLTEHPELTGGLRARVISIFIEKFTPPEKLEADVTIPDWSEDKQLRMDASYAADLEEVATIDGVTFITL